MNTFTEAMVTIAGLLVTVAIVSVVVSKKAQAPAVIQAAASGFGNVLGVAESPVTGASYNINLSYPGTDFSGSFGTG
jgi:PRD1 phage membrane DNA delivery